MPCRLFGRSRILHNFTVSWGVKKHGKKRLYWVNWGTRCRNIDLAGAIPDNVWGDHDESMLDPYPAGDQHDLPFDDTPSVRAIVDRGDILLCIMGLLLPGNRHGIPFAQLRFDFTIVADKEHFPESTSRELGFQQASLMHFLKGMTLMLQR